MLISTRLCAYDRSLLRASTTQAMVDDLHRLLTNANLQPPYILVGHSAGGFTLRVFAHDYPDEVAGLIFVDSSHPDEAAQFRAVLPTRSPDESYALKTARKDLTRGGDWAVSCEQARSVTSLGDIPLTVISKDPNREDCYWDQLRQLPPEIPSKWAKLGFELQSELATLSTNSTLVVATDACHMIPLDNPQVIADEIQKMLTTVRSR
jgi:pimeloyl-ACP methyl ester carboxylesterase